MGVMIRPSDAGHVARRTQRAWSVERDVPWAQLDFSLIAPVVRAPMAEAYGHILLAERLGFRVVQRMADVAPEGALRDGARAQLEDERRHVEFFARVTEGLCSSTHVSPNLALLEREIDTAKGYTSLMVLAQVMENAANALFSSYARHSLRMLKHNVRLPGSSVVEVLLNAVSRLVGADEALHIAFGMRVLRERCAGVTARERHALEEQVQTAAALMQAACAEVGKSYRRLGFGEAEVLARIARFQQRYWSHLEIEANAADVSRSV